MERHRDRPGLPTTDRARGEAVRATAHHGATATRRPPVARHGPRRHRWSPRRRHGSTRAQRAALQWRSSIRAPGDQHRRRWWVPGVGRARRVSGVGSVSRLRGRASMGSSCVDDPARLRIAAGRAHRRHCRDRRRRRPRALRPRRGDAALGSADHGRRGHRDLRPQWALRHRRHGARRVRAPRPRSRGANRQRHHHRARARWLPTRRRATPDVCTRRIRHRGAPCG